MTSHQRRETLADAAFAARTAPVSYQHAAAEAQKWFAEACRAARLIGALRFLVTVPDEDAVNTIRTIREHLDQYDQDAVAAGTPPAGLITFGQAT
jgi:hypothetical protein